MTRVGAERGDRGNNGRETEVERYGKKIGEREEGE